MADDTTEPAIPLTTPTQAAIPIEAYGDLVKLAESDLGSLKRTGLRLAMDVTEDKDARLRAVLTVKDMHKGTLDVGAFVTWRATGRYVGGVYVQWTKE